MDEILKNNSKYLTIVNSIIYFLKYCPNCPFLRALPTFLWTLLIHFALAKLVQHSLPCP